MELRTLFALIIGGFCGLVHAQVQVPSPSTFSITKPVAKPQTKFTLLDAEAPAPPSEELIAKFLTVREALFDARGIDVPQLTDDIVAAMSDAELLGRQGKYQLALNRLLTLERYMPLEEMPSHRVHGFTGWLYARLGNVERSQKHVALASAYQALLTQRIGKGDTQDNPLRTVLSTEPVEWSIARGVRAMNFKSSLYKGQLVSTMDFVEPVPSTQPKRLYSVLDIRTKALELKRSEHFGSLPPEKLNSEQRSLIELVRNKREQFLSDPGLRYGDLRTRLDAVLTEATSLEEAGKPREALAKLREIEALRPIQDIPTPRLWKVYGRLAGKTGEDDQQREMNGLLFGVQQAIATSGDARSAATAIPVMFVEEEHDWLVARRLTAKRRALQAHGTEQFNVWGVEEHDGTPHDVYFNITRMTALAGEEL
ncbi:hypothetical protein GCM10009091_31400 [Pseudomonas brenneri]|uniref:Uncharacterized protein n=1 Tax=Pseudomonas brenneri TaxID=129817 RepID=A0A5B2UNJ4_9PSED|nr:hypothetical protein [Pseudomonas brenneri]OPK02797.1 hypothetical protein BZ164_19950 [Pseudomonas veronii]KAA2228583.1 hypothetical protein F1720_18385 [Pseudomonas brenneri]TWR76091.1 hypothetical protein FJD34_21510 [Pseudomonas brenneri]SDU86227.1 hypothetical protein SAMN04490181_0683 [Pseudomonas brenneri]GGL47281.1 hypothetical protein GCM10009091_31400 [Pseudomonas brenneri]